MSYDDETLMAYADGELDEARRAEIAAAIASDPELARRVAQHRALRAQVSAAFAGVAEQPVPARLEAAVRGAAPRAEPRDNVVPFPARTSRAPASPWRAREWTAMAASLMLGAFLSWRFLAPSDPASVVAGDGSLVARGALAAALDSQLASEQGGDGAVLIGLSFKTTDGGYCRSFVAREAAIAGLACREGDEWRVPVTNAVEVEGGDLRTATTSMPPAILAAIEARLDGEPLDAAGEKAAREADWRVR
jgi:hypothetical protein